MAIQISGTTVVNNSRQLQNIASVDTTTKNAIEAAGVGGVFSFQNYGSVTVNYAFSGTGFTYQPSFQGTYNSFGAVSGRVVLSPTGNTNGGTRSITFTGGSNGSFAKFAFYHASGSYTWSITASGNVTQSPVGVVYQENTPTTGKTKVLAEVSSGSYSNSGTATSSLYPQPVTAYLLVGSGQTIVGSMPGNSSQIRLFYKDL